MQKSEKIALFDSGVGGLTVLDKLKKVLPNEQYLYFGDTKNVPYGEKSKQELIKLADKVFSFLEKQNVKAVVMACNTTSANVYKELKDKYNFKIYPIIQSCAKVISQMPIKKVGVFATAATINSRAYSNELKKHNASLEVFEMSCPPFVNFVETNTQNEPQNTEIIKTYLEKMLKNSPDKIVLGCTHYPYLLDIFKKFAPENIFIDPAIYFAQYIKEDLAKNNLLNSQKPSETFFVTKSPKDFQMAAKTFYDVKDLPTITTL